MRLDQKIKPNEVVPSFDKPSLRALSYALRHQELWPKDFKWAFHDCTTCAMGLAGRLWKTIPLLSYMEGAFGMDYQSAKDIFGGWGYMLSLPEITPEMVADKIDEYLAR